MNPENVATLAALEGAGFKGLQNDAAHQADVRPREPDREEELNNLEVVPGP
jgi:hypothetical protein